MQSKFARSPAATTAPSFERADVQGKRASLLLVPIPKDIFVKEPAFLTHSERCPAWCPFSLRHTAAAGTAEEKLEEDSLARSHSGDNAGSRQGREKWYEKEAEIGQIE